MRFLKGNLGNRFDNVNKDDRLYWDVLGCSALSWAVLRSTGLYWAVLESSGPDWLHLDLLKKS